jgi:hypothetical protein
MILVLSCDFIRGDVSDRYRKLGELNVNKISTEIQSVE